MSLTAYERETHINLNDEDDHVKVWTCQRTMITQLRKNPDYKEVDSGTYDGSEWARFTIPKELFRITSKKSRNLSEEQKKAAAERLAAARK